MSIQNLIGCYAEQRIVIGLAKSHHCQIRLGWFLVEWNLTVKAELNCKNAGNVKAVFIIRAALWAKQLEYCIQYCRNWKNKLWKLLEVVNTKGHSIRVLNKRSISDGGNLCPLWLAILKAMIWCFICNINLCPQLFWDWEKLNFFEIN